MCATLTSARTTTSPPQRIRAPPRLRQPGVLAPRERTQGSLGTPGADSPATPSRPNRRALVAVQRIAARPSARPIIAVGRPAKPARKRRDADADPLRVAAVGDDDVRDGVIPT